MKKTFALITAILAVAIQTHATNVSGLISANITWTKANSPYVVTGDIFVDTFATLTIEPGVEIRFDGYRIMRVPGKIIAVGTASDLITFTSNSSKPKISDWNGIEISYTGSNDTLQFSYCQFSYGGFGALQIKSNPASITHCTFNDNDAGVMGGTSPLAYVYISDCMFNNNKSDGARLSCKNIVTRCEFRNGQFGIESNNTLSIEASYNKFYNCTVSAINWCNNVHHNLFAYNNIAIFRCSNIVHNQAWYNSVGIRYYSMMSNDTVQYNSIKYNTRGADGPVPAGTIFNNNCIEKNKEYDYCNYDPGQSNLSMNYWGIIDSNLIMNRIYDFYDNFTSGRTTFMPVLSTPDNACADTVAITPTSVNPTTATGNQIMVYPNPVTNELMILSSHQTISEVFIYDLTGKEVLHTVAEQYKLKVNVTTLTHGMYLYRMRMNDDSIVTGKVMKE